MPTIRYGDFGIREVSADPPNENILICSECETHVPYRQTWRVDNGRVCPNCYARPNICTDCNNTIDRFDTYHANDDPDVLLCPECYSDRYVYCYECDRTFTRDEMTQYNNGDFCSECAEQMIACAGCNRGYNRRYLGSSSLVESGDEVYCSRCASRLNIRPDRRRGIRSEVLSGEGRETFTFGVEIEAEWGNSRRPWEIGRYHSDFPAPLELFFRGWRSERDGSLRNGAEMISPILSGVEGLAEILDAANTIKQHGGRVPTSCGQHITVGWPGPIEESTEDVIKGQMIAAILEDGLMALTGSYQRWDGHFYCRRLKTFPPSSLDNRTGLYHRTSVANIKAPNLIEFRYPPGTLEPSQIAMNIGLTQTVARMSVELEWDEVLGMYEDMKQLMASTRIRSHKAHASIAYGLKVLAGRGWHRGGAMDGLPYNPNERTSVVLSSLERGSNSIQLPSGARIASRMRRSVNSFYDRMNRSYWNVPEQTALWKQECMEIVNSRQARLEAVSA